MSGLHGRVDTRPVRTSLSYMGGLSVARAGPCEPRQVMYMGGCHASGPCMWTPLHGESLLLSATGWWGDPSRSRLVLWSRSLTTSGR